MSESDREDQGDYIVCIEKLVLSSPNREFTEIMQMKLSTRRDLELCDIAVKCFWCQRN